MKLLRPEIAELGEKFKKDPMKKQQETMKFTTKQELILWLVVYLH
jgi:YidC/Oxa1 family membrane protein insertase